MVPAVSRPLDLVQSRHSDHGSHPAAPSVQAAGPTALRGGGAAWGGRTLHGPQNGAGEHVAGRKTQQKYHLQT
eukprot:4105318-Prymnesium_polylepis.2